MAMLNNQRVNVPLIAKFPGFQAPETADAEVCEGLWNGSYPHKKRPA